MEMQSGIFSFGRYKRHGFPPPLRNSHLGMGVHVDTIIAVFANK